MEVDPQAAALPDALCSMAECPTGTWRLEEGGYDTNRQRRRCMQAVGNDFVTRV